MFSDYFFNSKVAYSNILILFRTWLNFDHNSHHEIVYDEHYRRIVTYHLVVYLTCQTCLHGKNLHFMRRMY